MPKASQFYVQQLFRMLPLVFSCLILSFVPCLSCSTSGSSRKCPGDGIKQHSGRGALGCCSSESNSGTSQGIQGLMLHMQCNMQIPPPVICTHTHTEHTIYVLSVPSRCTTGESAASTSTTPIMRRSIS